MSAGRGLRRVAGARLLFHRDPHEVCLAASGRLHRLPPELSGLVALLADELAPEAGRLVPWLETPGACALLLRLFNDGQLDFDDG